MDFPILSKGMILYTREYNAPILVTALPWDIGSDDLVFVSMLGDFIVPDLTQVFKIDVPIDVPDIEFWPSHCKTIYNTQF